jgi:hypothetical protein
METLKSKRFVLRKTLIGQGVVVEFTNKKGDNVQYDHDVAFSIMEPILNELPCWDKYKSYTATNNIPKVIRETSAVVNLTLAKPVEDEVEETENVEQEVEI